MFRLKVHNLPSNVDGRRVKQFFDNIAPMSVFNLQRNKMGNDTFALLTYNREEDANMVLNHSSSNLLITRWVKPYPQEQSQKQGNFSSFDTHSRYSRNQSSDFRSMDFNMDNQRFTNDRGGNWQSDQLSFGLPSNRKRTFDQRAMSSQNNDFTSNRNSNFNTVRNNDFSLNRNDFMPNRGNDFITRFNNDVLSGQGNSFTSSGRNNNFPPNRNNDFMTALDNNFNSSFNDNFVSRQNNNFRSGINNDIMQDTFDIERRNIDKRIMLLENKLKSTANNIQKLSRSITPPHRKQAIFETGGKRYSAPSNLSVLKSYAERFAPQRLPILKKKNLLAKAKDRRVAVAPTSAKYKFDTNLVRKMIFCYVRLFGVKSNVAIKVLGDRKILTADMVAYASSSNSNDEGGRSSIRHETGSENDPFSNPVPEWLANQKVKLGKAYKTMKKKIKKVFKEHCQDHRFIDTLKKEGPEDIQEELLQGFAMPVVPTKYDDLPKCPDPPENYFKICYYYDEMKIFWKAFTLRDMLAYNAFKHLFTLTPPLQSVYRDCIIYGVQVMGIYAIIDKKFVLKILSRHAPLIILKTEPSLVIGFASEKIQKEVLDRNGERIHHIKLYLRPYRNLRYENLTPELQTKIKRSLNKPRIAHLTTLFHNVHESYAPYIPLSELPDCDTANPIMDAIPDEDESYIFDEKTLDGKPEVNVVADISIQTGQDNENTDVTENNQNVLKTEEVVKQDVATSADHDSSITTVQAPVNGNDESIIVSD